MSRDLVLHEYQAAHALLNKIEGERCMTRTSHLPLDARIIKLESFMQQLVIAANNKYTRLKYPDTTGQ